MSDKIELLPCPFCGIAARLESNHDWHRIIVNHDEACIFLEPEVSMVPATDDQLSIVVADWNRRAALSQQPAPEVPEGYVLVAPEQLEKHTTTAWQCPPQSLVVLVSSLKRLHAKNTAAEQPDDYRWRAKSGLRYRDWQYGPMAKTAGGREGNPDIEIQALYLRPAAEQPDSARSIMTDEDMRRLRRFHEICEDSDAGGHDLPKEAVKRLERAGALRSCGFGRHEVTLFGDYLLGKEGV